LRVAFVALLSDKKLGQKLAPLQSLDEVSRIDLFRRLPFQGEKIRWVGVPAAIGRSTYASNLWRLATLLTLGWRYDVIVGCHQQYHGVFAWLAGRVWRRPVIQVVTAGVDWICERPLQRRALCAAKACGVRGLVAAERLRALGYTGVVETLANPMAIEASAASACRAPRYHLAVVGDLAEEKAYPWMIDVLARVRAHIPNLRVGIAASDAFQRRLGPTIDRRGLSSNLVFLGRQDEPGLASLYRSSRALLLTSCSEGLPQVVLEAMTYSLPVFVTAVGELPWLVRDGVEGRIVAYGETQAMVAALIAGLTDPASLEQMGRCARARIVSLREEFTVPHIAAAWRRLLAAACPRALNEASTR
jgi:glycosyltransferase involved in cell wall biosynthesis